MLFLSYKHSQQVSFPYIYIQVQLVNRQKFPYLHPHVNDCPYALTRLTF